MDLSEFKTYMQEEELSPNTITNYLGAVRGFFERYKEINKRNLIAYKEHLIKKKKAKSVNARILGLNKYLVYLKKGRLKLKTIREQNVTYLDNVISQADYEFFKTKLKAEPNKTYYFAVRFLCATGARISELVHFKAEHVAIGYIDIYTKGRKMRRIYIPRTLREEASEWLRQKGVESGYIFENYKGKGERMTPRGIAQQIKIYARRYGMNDHVVYPHSFRHRFAKNFIERNSDIALLADLMGHEKIETTRIYLRRTGAEQQAVVDEVVTW